MEMNTDFIVYTHNDIKEALKVINKNSKGAVVVVDKNNSLVRVLTDGDIRRALLSGCSLLSEISSIAFDSLPIALDEKQGKQAALKLMNEKEIDHIVVLDDKGLVKALHHRKDLLPILLSVPHMGQDEIKYVEEAFNSNWIAPLGPNVDGFEREIAEFTGAKHAAALTSGTSAIHLSLVLLDVKPEDLVFCSSLTFAASANPIMYQHATPVFIDSEPETWNMSPVALEKALAHYEKLGKTPKAIIVVNLYGQSADMDALLAISNKYNVPIIEDAAESLGATYNGKQSGTFGLFGIYSFNGNKIITTSGGGMLVSDNKTLIDKARFLSTQARDPSPYYQHTQVGYNYRMSNVLAGIGRGQLRVLSERINARRAVYQKYVNALDDIDCLDWMPELEGYFSNRWLTAVVLNPRKTNVSVTQFIDELRKQNIEARHVWKPMHLQPIFESYDYFTHGELSVSDYLFDFGVCLPSASSMSEADMLRVIETIKKVLKI
jgi:dTDP-4-amino-4,6-dideoxygalactose transaminase/CBS domain-containing protein